MRLAINRIWSGVHQNKPVGATASRQLVLIWLGLRIISSFFLAAVSYLRPLTDIEKRIPLLPPSQPFMSWLYRVFISPWGRWDADWFTKIVVTGYHANDGTTNFHPLFPWLAVPLYRLHIDPTLSLLIFGAVACIALLITYEKLALQDLDQVNARFATILLIFAPPAFVLFAPYSEGLFLVLAVLCLLWARKGSCWLAALAGGLATLTRQQGLFLLVPLAWEIWEGADHNFRKLLRDWKNIFSLILIPLGYLIWIIYRIVVVNDLKPDLTNPFTFITTLLVSPSVTNVVTTTYFTWPWRAIQLAVEKFISYPDLDIWINIVLSVGFLVLLVIAWKNMRWSYRLFAFVITLVSFSFYTGPIHPYMGLTRHLLLAFPVFIAAAPTFNRPWKRIFIISLFVLGWFFLLAMFSFEAWVP